MVIVNAYAPNDGAHDFMKQMLLDLNGDKAPILGDFNTILS